MEIMLCGAHDAATVSPMFSEVVANFGATPWFYQDGTIHHINSKTSSWTKNSRATVQKVDICVFVILDNYGEITWNEELDEALEQGKPFVVLALESSWNRYSILRRTISDPKSISSEDDQKMVDVLRKISDYEFTVISFTYASFQEKLRTHLSLLIEKGIKLLQTRNQREALIASLNQKGHLSYRQVQNLISLATDELEENKLSRKTAIKRLAAEEIRDDDFVLNICRSNEQGVQRLAFSLLPSLVMLPFKEDMLRELAEIAESNDDVGTQRRLVTSVTSLNPGKLDLLLEVMGRLEVGIRRRAFEGVEDRWDKIVAEWGPDRMKRFLELCYGKTTTGASWQERLRKQLDSLS